MAQPAATTTQRNDLGQYLIELVRAQIEKAKKEESDVSYSPERTLKELNFDEYDPAEITERLEAEIGISRKQADEVFRMFLYPTNLGIASGEPIGPILNSVSDYLTQQAQADPRLREGLERALAASP